MLGQSKCQAQTQIAVIIVIIPLHGFYTHYSNPIHHSTIPYVLHLKSFSFAIALILCIKV